MSYIPYRPRGLPNTPACCISRTMNAMPHIPKTQFSPTPGITVRYMKISDVVHSIIRIASYHTSQPMVNQLFKKNMFEMPFLSDDELARANTFKVLKKQVEWICGRLALKTLIQDELDLDISLEDIAVDYREKGAPYIRDLPHIPISLSHSGDYTAAALSHDTTLALGIDIERIGPMPDDGFMRTAFSPLENRHMPRTAQGIFTHWTLKEAFLKYIGLGFNESLHKAEIINGEIFHHGEKQALSVLSRVIEDRYILSLVWGATL